MQGAHQKAAEILNRKFLLLFIYVDGDSSESLVHQMRVYLFWFQPFVLVHVTDELLFGLKFLALVWQHAAAHLNFQPFYDLLLFLILKHLV